MIKRWIRRLIEERLTKFIAEELDYHVYGALSRRDFHTRKEDKKREKIIKEGYENLPYIFYSLDAQKLKHGCPECKSVACNFRSDYCNRIKKHTYGWDRHRMKYLYNE